MLIPRVLHLRRVHASVLKLQPYQETYLGSCIDALREGSTKVGISPPTRAGGTLVAFVSLLERLQGLPGNPKANRSLVVVNNIKLARQTEDQALEIEQGVRYTAAGIAGLCATCFRLTLSADTAFFQHHRGVLETSQGSMIPSIPSQRISWKLSSYLDQAGGD